MRGKYFREHLTVGDYYSQGMKVAGEWLGEGTRKLGLGGRVDEAAFLALCEGKNPSDRRNARPANEHGPR